MTTEPNAPIIDIEYRLLGRSGKTLFMCWYDGRAVDQVAIDLGATQHARRVRAFVDELRQKLPNEVESEAIETLMSERVTDACSELVSGGNNEVASRSQATELVEICNDVYLFSPPGAESEAYATITENSRRESFAVRSTSFRRWLVGRFYQQNEKAPGGQALQDAVNTITARAIAGELIRDVHLRLARRDDSIWLDLADKAGNAVEITSTGWRVVPGPDVPVAFIRRRGTMTLPTPVGGGSVDELRHFVNVRDDDDWRLIVAWLVTALRPGFPFPVLDVTGEQGSAKSTTTKVLRRMIDPHKVLARTPPREPRDLFIAATNSWVVLFDNASSLPVWLSDALCVLATGGGFGTRQLFTDDDEKLFEATRPVMLNGISGVVARSDLLDRSVSVVLPRIESETRMAEAVLWRRFDESQPRILGALLDAVAAGIGNLASVKIQSLPRMADFAEWGVATEPRLGWPEGSFLDAYLRNRGAAHEIAVETSAIGSAILALLERHPQGWEGTATELHADLEEHSSERTVRRKDWPKSPNALGTKLRRLAPNLRETGCGVTFHDRQAKQRHITLSRAVASCDPPASPSTSHAASPSRPSPSRDDGNDGDDNVSPDCSSSTPDQLWEDVGGTDSNDCPEKQFRW